MTTETVLPAGWTIEPAVTLTRHGREKRDGFDVFFEGRWDERYRLKSDAVRHVARLNGDRVMRMAAAGAATGGEVLTKGGVSF